MKYFDITFLEDLNAFDENELGIQQLKILSFFINTGSEIIIERRPNNDKPQFLQKLSKDNCSEFIKHWTEIFNKH